MVKDLIDYNVRECFSYNGFRYITDTYANTFQVFKTSEPNSELKPGEKRFIADVSNTNGFKEFKETIELAETLGNDKCEIFMVKCNITHKIYNICDVVDDCNRKNLVISRNTSHLQFEGEKEFEVLNLSNCKNLESIEFGPYPNNLKKIIFPSEKHIISIKSLELGNPYDNRANTFNDIEIVNGDCGIICEYFSSYCVRTNGELKILGVECINIIKSRIDYLEFKQLNDFCDAYVKNSRINKLKIENTLYTNVSKIKRGGVDELAKNNSYVNLKIIADRAEEVD